MAVTVRAGSAVVSAGAATTAAETVTPTLPAGTVSGDRVFIFGAGGDGTVALTISDANWTQVYNASLGGGTYGAATGPRRQAAWYRDYDGLWTMPSVTSPSGPSSNTGAACAVSVIPSAGQTFDSPTVVTGSMTTASASMSVTSSTANTWTTDGLVLLHDVFPSTATTASATLTATGVTFGTKTNTVVSAGTTSGNDVALAVWTAPVTTGAATAATATHTLLITSHTAGVGFVQQTSSAAASAPIQARIIVSNPARVRASYW